MAAWSVQSARQATVPQVEPLVPDDVARVGTALTANFERVVRGKDDAVSLAVLTLLAGGHLLLEDVPGVGKTVLAKTLARSIGGVFKRIQGTPDLLPADITGSAVWMRHEEHFSFVPGPIFANVVVVDEINRATPRAQAALLEAMEEGQVSAEGDTYELPDPFMVVATRNTIEDHGTYLMPTSELDRFSVSTSMGYPSPGFEREIVARQLQRHPVLDVTPVVSLEEVRAARAAVARTYVHPAVLDYAVAVVGATREEPDCHLGASPRASLALVHTAQARARLAGRDFVSPDDVQALALPVLAHRLVLRRGSRSVADLVHDLVTRTAVPLPDADAPAGG